LAILLQHRGEPQASFYLSTPHNTRQTLDGLAHVSELTVNLEDVLQQEKNSTSPPHSPTSGF
jgi:hypothetical protein